MTNVTIRQGGKYMARNFVFDGNAYLDTLSRARASVATLPHECPEHHGRKFHWPWHSGE